MVYIETRTTNKSKQMKMKENIGFFVGLTAFVLGYILAGYIIWTMMWFNALTFFQGTYGAIDLQVAEFAWLLLQIGLGFPIAVASIKVGNYLANRIFEIFNVS